MPDTTVALVQQRCSSDPLANRTNSENFIREAAQSGAQLVLLQELHNGLYFCQTENPEHFSLAETIPGPSTDFYGALARELGIVLVISLFEKRMTGLYHNTAVVLECDGSIAGIYRKMHIPDDPGFYEKYYFTPGDLGFTPINTSVGRLGVLICWDQWFPEAARLMALAGAEILLYPTAIGWEPGDPADEKQRQKDAWITVQRGHAIANHLPVVCANRCGHETSEDDSGDGIDFWGGSFICGPQGELLHQASSDHEGILISTVRTSETARQRHIWPFLRDRRVESYQNLTRLCAMQSPRKNLP